MKGSPEKIYELCNKESIPDDFNQILFKYTKLGFRVIGLASKEIKNQDSFNPKSAKREEIERDLHFLGLMIMKNELKDVTSDEI